MAQSDNDPVRSSLQGDKQEHEENSEASEEQLRELNFGRIGSLFETRARDKKTYSEIDSIIGLFNIDLNKGPTFIQYEDNRNKFGENKIPGEEVKTLPSEFIRSPAILASRVLIILIAIQMVYHLKKEPWNEALRDLAIITIVSFSALLVLKICRSDKKCLAELQMENSTFIVNVLRSGDIISVFSDDIVAGDIYIAKCGDIVPADGICIDSCEFVCDETGVSNNKLVQKGPMNTDLDPYVLSGSLVTCGVAKVFCLGIGPNSLNGKKKPSSYSTSKDRTSIENGIYKFSRFYGILWISIIVIKFLIGTIAKYRRDYDVEILHRILDIIGQIPWYIALTILVSPVTTLSIINSTLLHLSRKLIRHNLLVRNYSKLVLAGLLENVCIDERGVITMEKMAVVDGAIACAGMFPISNAFVQFDGNGNRRKIYTRQMFFTSITDNCIEQFFRSMVLALGPNKNIEKYDAEFINEGPKLYSLIKCNAMPMYAALQDIINDFKIDTNGIMNAYTIHKTYISTQKDYIASISSSGNECLVFSVIGNINEIYQKATHYLDCTASSPVEKVSKKDSKFQNNVKGQLLKHFRRALHGLAVAYGVLPISMLESLDEITLENFPSDLIFLGMLGVENPIRPGVSNAVAALGNSGLNTIMITENDLNMAIVISRKCNMTREGSISIEGPSIPSISPQKFSEMGPVIKVVANSNSKHKGLLIDGYKSHGSLVGSTLSKLDDVPLMEKLDLLIGLDSAIPAIRLKSDMVLKNNSLVGFAHSVVYGRFFLVAARRILTYKISVAFTVLLLSIIISAKGFNDNVTLTPLMLAWLGLLSNQMSIALSRDSPENSVLEFGPEKEDVNIFSMEMANTIVYIVLSNLLVLYLIYRTFLDRNFESQDSKKHMSTLLFNSLIIFQPATQILSRTIHTKNNFLTQLLYTFKNKFFLKSTIIFLVLHMIIVNKFHETFGISGVSAYEFAVVILYSALSIPIMIIWNKLLALTSHYGDCSNIIPPTNIYSTSVQYQNFTNEEQLEPLL